MRMMLGLPAARAETAPAATRANRNAGKIRRNMLSSLPHSLKKADARGRVARAHTPPHARSHTGPLSSTIMDARITAYLALSTNPGPWTISAAVRGGRALAFLSAPQMARRSEADHPGHRRHGSGPADEVHGRGEDAELPALAKQGSFRRLTTSIPPQSPVAWSNLITGMNAGGHGIFDFIHRDPKTLQPYFSTSRVEAPKHSCPPGQLGHSAGRRHRRAACVTARHSGNTWTSTACPTPSSASRPIFRRSRPRDTRSPAWAHPTCAGPTARLPFTPTTR